MAKINIILIFSIGYISPHPKLNMTLKWTIYATSPLPLLNLSFTGPNETSMMDLSKTNGIYSIGNKISIEWLELKLGRLLIILPTI
jgi:hypothetical protein